MRHPLHLALAACLVSGVANAQSFNCGPAHFLDERAICQGHRQVMRLKPRRYAQSGLGTLKVMPERPGR